MSVIGDTRRATASLCLPNWLPRLNPFSLSLALTVMCYLMQDEHNCVEGNTFIINSEEHGLGTASVAYRVSDRFSSHLRFCWMGHNYMHRVWCAWGLLGSAFSSPAADFWSRDFQTINFTWKHIRNANSQASSQKLQIRPRYLQLSSKPSKGPWCRFTTPLL